MLWESNTFVSEKPISKEIFNKNNLSKIIVGGDNHRNRDNIHCDMKLTKFEVHKDYQPPQWHFELTN